MQLTDEQKAAVKQWVSEGAGLSEIQKKLTDQFQMSMTYMDVRFLILDLGLTVKESQKGFAKRDSLIGKQAEAGGPAEEDVEEEEALDAGGPSRVSLSVDRITKPGSVVSGTVTFSDGVKATWFIDQFGRLALESSKPKYRPSREDLAEFQQALKSALDKRAF
jgi:hypothetical protein